MKKGILFILVMVMGVNAFGQLQRIKMGTGSNTNTGDPWPTAWRKADKVIELINWNRLYTIDATELAVLNNASVKPKEFQMLAGVDTTLTIQAQIDGKADTSDLTGVIMAADTAAMLNSYAKLSDLTDGGISLGAVQDEIADSLNIMRAAVVMVSDTSAMLSKYALISELGEAGVSISDVRDEIADTLNIIRPNITTAYADRLKWDGGSSGLAAATGRASLGAGYVGNQIFQLQAYDTDGLVAVSIANVPGVISWDGAESKLIQVAQMFTIPTFYGAIPPKKASAYGQPVTDTLATQAYARQYGGSGTVTISDVQYEIADSLNVMRAAVIMSADTAAMLGNYTRNGEMNAALANYVAEADTASMLGNYARNGELNAALANYVAEADTASILANYARNGEVAARIQDSLDARIGAGINLAEIAVLLADSTTAYVTPAQLADSLANAGVGVSIGDVRDEIADSLNARIGEGLELSDIAVMLADSTGNAPGNYVTRKALIDSIAAAGTGTGVSITDVRNEIADSLNAIRDNSIPGLAAADTANLVATHYYVSQHSGSSWDSTYVHYRIDSLVTVIDGLNTEIENLWNAVALLGNLDINAPGFESAEIGTYADDTLLVLFDATDIQQDSVPPASAFTLWDGATEHGIASVDINVDSLFLVLDSAAIYGSTYTLDYTRGTPALQDSSGNKTSSWTARSVTNNMEEPAASGLLSGLTAYWDLQESSLPIVDEVASLTSTGTVGSTAIELSMAGRISNSMEFNYLPTYGGGQRIVVGDDLLQHGTISVSLWFYLTSTDQDAFCMIHNTNPGSQNRGFYFFIGGVGGGVAVRAYNSSGSYVEADTDPGYTTAAANTWYHAVFVADGTNLTVYVNGVQRAQESFPYSISYGADATLIIGGRDSANGWTMNGRLDEIGFWNRALTTDEITALYNGGSGLAYSSFGD